MVRWGITMIVDKRHWSNKLVSLVLVLIFVNTGFYGLTVENAAAYPASPPSEVYQIADEYIKSDEQYFIYYVNDYNIYFPDDEINEWYVIVYYILESDSNPDGGFTSRKIMGSLAVDSNFQPLLQEDITTQDIFYVPALAYHYDKHTNEVYQNFHDSYIDRSNRFNDLASEALDSKDQVDLLITEHNLFEAFKVVEQFIGIGGGAYIGTKIAFPVLLNTLGHVADLVGQWEFSIDLERIETTKYYLEQISLQYSNLASIYTSDSEVWLNAAEGSYKHIQFIIPGSGSLEDMELNRYINVLGYYKYTVNLEQNPPQDIINNLELAIDDLMDQKANGRNIVGPKIRGYYYDMVLNYRLEGKTIPGVISETHTCDSITVTATYFYDSDNDGSATLYYKPSSSGLWVPYYSMTKDADTKTYTKTISGLSENTNYDIEVEFSDPDGVDIGNPLHAYSINTGECMVSPSTPTIYDLGTSDDGSYHVTME